MTTRDLSNLGRLCLVLCATGALVAAATPLTATAQVLLHDYNFSNNSGADSVGTANGTLVGGATITGNALNTTATAGQGLALNGSSVTTSAVVGITGSFTIEDFATVQNDTAYFPTLFSFGTDTNNYLLAHPHIFNQGGEMTIELATSANGGVRLNLGQQSGVGTEQMFAVTYDATSGVATAYLNGVAMDHATLLGAFNLSAVAGSAAGGIGGLDSYNDPAFNGTTQNFAIYSGARSGAQIAADYASVVPEPSTWAAVLAGSGVLALVLRRRVALA